MKPYNPLNLSFWLTVGAVTGNLLLPILYIIGYALGFVGFFIFLAVAGEIRKSLYGSNSSFIISDCFYFEHGY